MGSLRSHGPIAICLFVFYAPLSQSTASWRLTRIFVSLCYQPANQFTPLSTPRPQTSSYTRYCCGLWNPVIQFFPVEKPVLHAENGNSSSRGDCCIPSPACRLGSMSRSIFVHTCIILLSCMQSVPVSLLVRYKNRTDCGCVFHSGRGSFADIYIVLSQYIALGISVPGEQL